VVEALRIVLDEKPKRAIRKIIPAGTASNF